MRDLANYVWKWPWYISIAEADFYCEVGVEGCCKKLRNCRAILWYTLQPSADNSSATINDIMTIHFASHYCVLHVSCAFLLKKNFIDHVCLSSRDFLRFERLADPLSMNTVYIWVWRFTNSTQEQIFVIMEGMFFLTSSGEGRGHAKHD